MIKVTQIAKEQVLETLATGSEVLEIKFDADNHAAKIVDMCALSIHQVRQIISNPCSDKAFLLVGIDEQPEPPGGEIPNPPTEGEDNEENKEPSTEQPDSGTKG